jgi:hypothetical protein
VAELGTQVLRGCGYEKRRWQVAGLDETTSHVLLVLMERAALETSPWREYLSSCPASFGNALELTAEEIRILEGSPVVPAATDSLQRSRLG